MALALGAAISLALGGNPAARLKRYRAELEKIEALLWDDPSDEYAKELERERRALVDHINDLLDRYHLED